MTTTVSTWCPETRGTEETFIVARPEGAAPFAAQLDRLFDEYRATLGRLGLDGATGVTATVFLSDSANQEDEVRAHPAFTRLLEDGMAVTVVQQPPADTKIGLLAYHVRRSGGVRTIRSVDGARARATALEVEAGPYRFLYMKNLMSPAGGGAADQTEALLGTPGRAAQSHGIALGEVVRTWLYIHDLDTNYAAVSSARNRIFDRQGITLHAGFPASTGIQGRSANAADVLLLDVLAIQGLQPGQNRRMEVTSHMNPTVEYGVTFERGREVVFGDRRHLYVSGTASISHKGEILHVGDVTRQTERAIVNVGALLANSGATLADLRYVIVYLRDFADAAAVDTVLAAGPLGDLPRITVHAPVCRPGWLVELEGVAIDGKGDARFAPF